MKGRPHPHALDAMQNIHISVEGEGRCQSSASSMVFIRRCRNFVLDGWIVVKCSFTVVVDNKIDILILH